MTQTRYDFIEVKADVSPEGWIRDNPVITRAGIFIYRSPNGKITKELRHPDDVFKQDSLASLHGIPITDGHKGMITSDNSTNIVGTVLAAGSRNDDNVVAPIIIHDSKRIGTKRELSLGYRCDVEETPGEYNGEKYHARQRNISYNHLAVIVKGRAGNARLRLDASDAVCGDFELLEEKQMSEVKLVTIRLDGIDYQAAPEVSNALGKRQEQLTELQKKFDAVEAERDSFKQKNEKHDAEIAKIRDDVRAEMQQRASVENQLKQLELKFDESETLIDLKKKALTKLSPSLKLDGKSDDYINSAFDVAMELDAEKNKKLSEQKGKTSARSDNKDDKPTGAEAARAAMIEKMRNQHLPKTAA